MDTTLSPDAVTTLRTPRFEHIAITSVFGDPRELRTWSGAPANVANALERRGVVVKGIRPRVSKLAKVGIALADMLDGHGRPLTSEQVLRSLSMRHRLAAQVSEAAQRLGVRDVLHTGTFDLLPSVDTTRGIRHYLYCDHTWALASLHHVHADRFTARARRAYDRAERASFDGLAHVFTFGRYVRDNLIAHYGVSPSKVTAVGSGMGAIEPWHGAKDYARPKLLFVAKHLFKAKGGELLVEAFRAARSRRPDLTLTIVGDPRSRALVADTAGIAFRDHLPWAELQQLYRDSTLLVQPMLNDPWGQVYLEAMISRTPVMGLARNGLPELVDGGRHGFLVDRATPEALADAIVCALSDPARLERMATVAQHHVVDTYSWDRVAEKILFS
ncbi:Glycosyltransferase involved in cell wall bisynthesis [Enhydrobacter aerosaccus]|uniref:Glycosyltransferase involved in cell wall bisynthesis n=1 Tax=Enhydrobacter aerosaccus TaxID=225324 RepID=A0A1T4TC00_9HYPH|nr:glycosyltransferase family 4 protein [Enhydrobacter aerosaccus]SKA37916.1 Glycosyltransferase involved in cell wall bisynthesis [Enhydrobacter aerosaccus]